MAEFMKNGDSRARFEYAEDIGIIGILRTIKEATAKVQQELDSLLE